FRFLFRAASGRQQNTEIPGEHHDRTRSSPECRHVQKVPVSVCNSAKATRYRVSASSDALRDCVTVFCASTTSRAVASPAPYRRLVKRRLSAARSATRRRLSTAALAASASLYIENRLLKSWRCAWLSPTCACRSRVCAWCSLLRSPP